MCFLYGAINSGRLLLGTAFTPAELEARFSGTAGLRIIRLENEQMDIPIGQVVPQCEELTRERLSEMAWNYGERG